MPMSHKHHQALADAIKQAKRDGEEYFAGDPPATQAVTKVAKMMAHEIATVCYGDNPSFDRRKFLEACGLDDTQTVEELDGMGNRLDGLPRI